MRRNGKGCRAAAGWILALLAVLVIWELLCPPRALAIPAFARKYQTSCQTCHVAFPMLTPFGEAFRENGYRFPAGMDASISKDQPVSLGAEGYKKLWPQAVWPGEMPGLPPLAVIITNSMSYDPVAQALSLDGLGSDLELFAAGTMGEHYSFWSSVEFARTAGVITPDMARVNFQIRPLDDPTLQFKIGSFEPGLMLVTTHRSVMDQDLLALTQTVGDNLWAPEPYQQGVEAFGVLDHSLMYNAGVVDGSGSIGDKSKDFYGRLAYKMGGLAPDGVPKGGAGEGFPANPKPWSEKSLSVSGFAYKGKGILGTASTGPVGDPFRAFGGDVGVDYLDWMLHAGVVARRDDSPLLADSSVVAPSAVKATSVFAELTWVAYPWLIPAGRWESFKTGPDESDRVSVTLTALLQANVKTNIATDWLKDPGGRYRNEEVSASLIFGF